MGWRTETVGGSELLIGDEPVDLAGDMVDRIATLYMEEAKRRPTADELAHTLEVALSTRVESLLEGSEDKQLQYARIKLKKRSRTQKIVDGDLFAVPLPSGDYGFGRVRRRFLNTVILGDLYAMRSPVFLKPSELAKAPVLFEALFGYGRLASWKWPILGNLPSAEPVSPLPEKSELEEHAQRLLVYYGPVGLEERLEEELWKRFGGRR